MSEKIEREALLLDAHVEKVGLQKWAIVLPGGGRFERQTYPNFEAGRRVLAVYRSGGAQIRAEDLRDLTLSLAALDQDTLLHLGWFSCSAAELVSVVRDAAVYRGLPAREPA